MIPFTLTVVSFLNQICLIFNIDPLNLLFGNSHVLYRSTLIHNNIQTDFFCFLSHVQIVNFKIQNLKFVILNLEMCYDI